MKTVKKNYVLMASVIGYGFLQYFYFDIFADGLLTPFVTLLFMVLLLSLSRFFTYRGEQLFFFIGFLLLELILSFSIAMSSHGNLLTNNLSLFLYLTVYPCILYTIFGLISYGLTIKFPEHNVGKISFYFLFWSICVSCGVALSAIFYALSYHSV